MVGDLRFIFPAPVGMVMVTNFIWDEFVVRSRPLLPFGVCNDGLQLLRYCFKPLGYGGPADFLKPRNLGARLAVANQKHEQFDAATGDFLAFAAWMAAFSITWI